MESIEKHIFIDVSALGLLYTTRDDLAMITNDSLRWAISIHNALQECYA
jgi:hypothetical protein